MEKARPFPTIEGGCYCKSTRYRLQSSPLFCHACHCADCNKLTGSVYACYTDIEVDRISYIGATPPKITTTPRPDGRAWHVASCAKCGTRLWSGGVRTPVTAEIATGTLDFPQLMEPDLHGYIESKIPWVVLPEGAKTCKGPFDYREHWPKSSLKRLEAATLRAEERLRARKAVLDGQEGEEEKEADKTPTAQTPDEKEDVVDDDEEFVKRYRETEKALHERLEQLSLKLSEHDKDQEDDSRAHVVETSKEPVSSKGS